jgi:hypothetical protein
LKRNRVALLGLLAIGGCTSYGNVTPLSGGRYLMTASAKSVSARAGDFCNSREERVEILNVGRDARISDPTQVSVVFRCLWWQLPH